MTEARLLTAVKLAPSTGMPMRRWSKGYSLAMRLAREGRVRISDDGDLRWIRIYPVPQGN